MSAGFPSGTRGRCKAPPAPGRGRRRAGDGRGKKTTFRHLGNTMTSALPRSPARPGFVGLPGTLAPRTKSHMYFFLLQQGALTLRRVFRMSSPAAGLGPRTRPESISKPRLSRMSARLECWSRWTRFNNMKAGTLPLCWLRKRGFHRSQSRNNSSLRLARKGVSTEL